MHRTKLNSLKITSKTMALIVFILLMTQSISQYAYAIVSDEPRLEWQKTYGTYNGNKIVKTVDGGYAVAGVTASYSFEKYRGYGQYEPLLIKIDSNGETEWAKTYNISGGASMVVQTQDNGFLLCGDRWLLKTDTNGNPQWNTTMKIGVRYVAIQTSSEDYLAGGYYYDVQSGNFIPIIYKFDSQGNQLWNKTFTLDTPVVSASWIEGVEEATDGNYIIVGTWNGDFWFAKTDTNGNLLVNKTYHYNDPAQNGPESFDSISKTSDDCFILSAGDGANSWLFKINSNGNEEWHQFYGGNNSDKYTILLSAAETTDGGFVATGGQHSQAIVLKTDKFGREEWNVTYGEEETIDTGNTVIAINNGFILTGHLNHNVWVAKFVLQTITASPTVSPLGTEHDLETGTTILLLTALIIAVSLIGVAVVIIRKKVLLNEL
jgi:hypothetical protein